METTTKKETSKTSEPALIEYHFAGSGEYIPVTIKASSIDEATKKWEEVRVAVDAGDLSIEN